MTESSPDAALLRRAINLARRGIGSVEPNPPVGAIVTDPQGRIIGKGWHERYGGPHAEVHALADAGAAAQGATLYVTLEPCCHQGKTPPCTDAVLAAGIRRVVIGTRDPNRHGPQSGIEILREAGLEVTVCEAVEAEAQDLIAPFTQLVTQGLPWVHAKWAMTADGKLATRTGSSQWITNELSRAVVHQLRGRMDAILTGIGTVLADDPLLTARPAGPRTATRVVLDSRCRIPITSRMVQSAGQAPVLIITTQHADPDNLQALRRQGIEILEAPMSADGQISIVEVVRELGRRKMTHVLIEAGNRVLGSLFDHELVNEVHAFMAPVLAGGEEALSPVGGTGVHQMSDAIRLESPDVRVLDGDVYLHGRVNTTRRDDFTG